MCKKTRKKTGKKRDPLEYLAARVACKLEEADFKGAVRLACSDDTIAAHSSDTLDALREKHPEPHPDSVYMQPPHHESFSFPITEGTIIQTIRLFPNDSAGGPDRLRPQHLKDLTGAPAGEGGNILLRSLTSLITLILGGNTPKSIRPYFFGASLVALKKKDDGIRPIAVGCTLRRLAAKCASLFAKQSIPDLLAPRQLGYGITGGVEAAVHAARCYLQNLQQGEVLVKVDFKNAFNSIRRDKMLLAVEELIPEILPFVHSVYCSPSFLMWGEEVIYSSEGVQQGDPLGPLLFCLTIHKLCKKLTSEFNVFYLDDGTVGGYCDDVVQDVKMIEEGAGALGLQLNRGKTELICTDPVSRKVFLSAFPDVKSVDPECAVLLGSPIGNSNSVDVFIKEKINLLKVLGDRLCLLHVQDAIILLRNSLAIPKVLHLLRTAPCCLSSTLQDFDQLLKSLLGKISNIDFHENEPAWLQATLPVSYGGLGIRSVVHLAPSAFLASADGSANLVKQLLPLRFHNCLHPDFELALSYWREGLDHIDATIPDSPLQKKWDAPRIQARFDHLLSHTSDPKARARLLAVSTKESGAWINALPVSSLGLP